MDLYVGGEKPINANLLEAKGLSAFRTFDEREKEVQLIEKAEKEQRKREKQSPFGRWTQFNLEHTDKMMWLQLNHPRAAAILTFLVDQMDEYNAVMCSYKVMQEVLEVSEPTIVRNLRVLKERGYIAVLKSGTSNIYTVNHDTHWKSWGNNRKYSKFPANVVLALTEQDKPYQLSFEELSTSKVKQVKLPEEKTDE